MNFVMETHIIKGGNASARIECALIIVPLLRLPQSLALLWFVRGIKRKIPFLPLPKQHPLPNKNVCVKNR